MVASRSMVSLARSRMGVMTCGLRRVEAQLRPIEPEHASGDGPAGDTRDVFDAAEEVRFIETPERPEVEEHSAIASAREAESYPFLRLPERIVARNELHGGIRHRTTRANRLFRKASSFRMARLRYVPY